MHRERGARELSDMHREEREKSTEREREERENSVGERDRSVRPEREGS